MDLSYRHSMYYDGPLSMCQALDSIIDEIADSTRKLLEELDLESDVFGRTKSEFENMLLGLFSDPNGTVCMIRSDIYSLHHELTKDEDDVR